MRATLRWVGLSGTFLVNWFGKTQFTVGDAIPRQESWAVLEWGNWAEHRQARVHTYLFSAHYCGSSHGDFPKWQTITWNCKPNNPFLSYDAFWLGYFYRSHSYETRTWMKLKSIRLKTWLITQTVPYMTHHTNCPRDACDSLYKQESQDGLYFLSLFLLLYKIAFSYSLTQPDRISYWWRQINRTLSLFIFSSKNQPQNLTGLLYRWQVSRGKIKLA